MSKNRIFVLLLCVSSVTHVQALNQDDYNDEYSDYADTLVTTTTKDNITEDLALNQDLGKVDNATEHDAATTRPRRTGSPSPPGSGASTAR